MTADLLLTVYVFVATLTSLMGILFVAFCLFSLIFCGRD